MLATLDCTHICTTCAAGGPPSALKGLLGCLVHKAAFPPQEGHVLGTALVHLQNFRTLRCCVLHVQAAAAPVSAPGAVRPRRGARKGAMGPFLAHLRSTGALD